MLPKSVQNLINEFARLPGIGPKTAARLALFYVRAPEERAKNLAKLLEQLNSQITTCSSCFTLTDVNSNPCSICSLAERNQSELCVVESPLDLLAFEQGGLYKGLYFVLGGLISPLDGVGPQDIRISQLKKKVKELVVSKKHPEKSRKDYTLEVILALNPSTEGETTGLYIKEECQKIGNVKFTRLAVGLPTGADIDYADSYTLRMALEGRREVE